MELNNSNQKNLQHTNLKFREAVANKVPMPSDIVIDDLVSVLLLSINIAIEERVKEHEKAWSHAKLTNEQRKQFRTDVVETMAKLVQGSSICD